MTKQIQIIQREYRWNPGRWYTFISSSFSFLYFYSLFLSLFLFFILSLFLSFCFTDMGLGKTIQSIAFLSAIVGEQIADFSFFKNKKRTPINNNNNNSSDQAFQPALVVMPAGVIQQWVREFKKVQRMKFINSVVYIFE